MDSGHDQRLARPKEAQVMDTILEVICYLGIGLIWLLLAIVAIKIVWNFALPYGMLKLKSGQGVSTFPLIEFLPLLLAAAISWPIDESGVLKCSNILIYGIGIVLLSYFHFFFVAIIVGIIRSKADKDHNAN
jgi:hypothetical protein